MESKEEVEEKVAAMRAHAHALANPKGPSIVTTIIVCVVMAAFFIWAISCSMKNKASELRKRAEPQLSTSLTKCQNAVKVAAEFPSSVDFFIFDSNTQKDDKTGEVEVTAAFEAKNRFGNMIPQAAICKFGADGEITGFSIVNR